jgi:penicillin G amidase
VPPRDGRKFTDNGERGLKNPVEGVEHGMRTNGFKLAKVVKRAAAMLGMALAAVLLLAWWLVAGSLPVLDAVIEESGRAGELELQRDANGIVRVVAESRGDALYALGYAHGQDRFFQMDLLRRASAGELSELIGAATVKTDKARRLHRMRARAQRLLATLDQDVVEELRRYTDGVNAGLNSLRSRPFPYYALRSRPKPWLAEDSILAGYSMFFDLQDSRGYGEEARALARESFSPMVYEFLYKNGSAHAVPMLGEGLAVRPPPAAEEWPERPERMESAEEALSEAGHPGSNAWAVSGDLARGGGAALLAVDMHLGQRVPNTWYRATLEYERNGRFHRVSGVTLPGVPGVIVGSNGAVAWGFTNAYIDLVDLVEWIPEAGADVEKVVERVAVRGAESVEMVVRETPFGPLRKGAGKTEFAIQWAAHKVGFFNFELLQLGESESVEAALGVAAEAGIPTQNIVVADANGTIGWTLCGGIPWRREHDGRYPLRSDDPRAPWRGRLPGAQYPVILRPDGGRIWTANNAVAERGEVARLLGDGGYSDDGRALVIFEGLMEREVFEEADFLALQLLDRSRYYDRWRAVFVELLDDAAWAGAAENREALVLALREWDGYASLDSNGFPLLRDLRTALAREVLPAAYAPLSKDLPRRIWLADVRQDEVLFQLVTRGSPDIVGLEGGWAAVVRAIAEQVLEDWQAAGKIPGQTPFRETRQPRFAHPMSLAVPVLARWLDMPREALPGDRTTPRTQTNGLSASQRLVVRPGHETQGILHMPTGQSEHFLSPFYRAGHADWVEGRPTPLVPGPAVHAIRWRPPE